MTIQKESEETILDQRLDLMIKAYLDEVGELKVGYPSERNLTQYEEILHIDRRELKGKTILDVGLSNKFMRDAQKEGLDVTALEGDRQHAEHSPFSDKVVHGLGQEMPFPPNSFDIVIANASVPLHIEGGDDFGALLSIYQLLRACKQGGKVIICPLPEERRMRREKIIDLHQLTFPRPQKRWNIDLLALLDDCNLNYRGQQGEKHIPGDWVYHIGKPFNTDLKPIQRELIRLGELRGLV